MMTNMTRHFTAPAKPGDPPDRRPAPAPPKPPWWRVWLLPAGFFILEDSLAIRLGGRPSEMLVIGEASTGASSDLTGATNLAVRMVRD